MQKPFVGYTFYMRLTRVLHNGKLNTVKKFRLKNGGKVGL
jgi:hypothetical protein